MELTAEQVRVLGCLVEKSATTPDNYPLTSNSLVSACNQKSSRDPQMALAERDIDAAMLELRQLGLARTLTTGGRTVKHRHIADEALELSPAALAVLSVLMLRGPQTVGELRTRTERQHRFDDLESLDRVLESLAARTDPLVTRLEREPGRKEPRWMHLLLGEAWSPGDVSAERATPPAAATEQALTTDETTELEKLRAEVLSLRERVDQLFDLLGVQPEEDPS